MTRIEANFKLIQELINLVGKNPDMRFGQILLNYGFVKQERPAKPEARISWQDEFYSEPQDLLKRVKQRIEDIEITNKQLEDKK